MELEMFLFLLEASNLLLGSIPETAGLLLFGITLISITVGLRWFLNENGKEANAEESLERITKRIN
jgi:hypothetical protein